MTSLFKKIFLPALNSDGIIRYVKINKNNEDIFVFFYAVVYMSTAPG